MSGRRVYLCGIEDAPPGPYRGTPDSKGWDHATLARVLACPREAEHSYGPSGYIDWADWADRSRRHWRQKRCVCGLYLIVVPKPGMAMAT